MQDYLALPDQRCCSHTMQYGHVTRHFGAVRQGHNKSLNIVRRALIVLSRKQQHAANQTLLGPGPLSYTRILLCAQTLILHTKNVCFEGTSVTGAF